MNKTLEGMARAYHEASDAHHSEKILAAAAALLGDNVKDEMDKMRRALLWLADNVSDEMVYAAVAPDVQNMANFKIAFRGTIERARAEIAAALRAAAGDGK